MELKKKVQVFGLFHVLYTLGKIAVMIPLLPWGAGCSYGVVYVFFTKESSASVL